LQLEAADEEDSDEVQHLATDYKMEMQFMLRSVSDSINDFSGRLWVREDDLRLQETVKVNKKQRAFDMHLL
jgi:hypothetical protein